ncbi:DsbA family protein [Parvibaculum sp.]|uniref:DsbA family protein n=1 Tax=Parvibaculum sp. TaxID=2024848 RepID=UPI001B11EBA5|nr:DsbA family protein [Parvibaculum sp.]MBO6634053.1 DsbA family protein [Parvibaculum sp.]MBO6678079.1 DsbA family protein [Parvibaculum sp.]MBO6684400.1 DsbA family protein [Parvibaculum sp.]
MVKAFISRNASSLLTSRALRNTRRALFALRRRLTGGTPTVHYFHQADDPYSHVAVQMLAPLRERYRVAIKVWLVAPPDEAAAPEMELLKSYGRRDAARLAREYGLDFPEGAAAPDPALAARCTALLAQAIRKKSFTEIAVASGRALWTGDEAALSALEKEHGAASARDTERAVARGTAKRRKLGHYLSGMFCFEGEWYWGVDRLNYLEERLAEAGLDRAAGTPMLAPWRDLELAPPPASTHCPVIDYWFSFRSPYSWISVPRMRKLARHYNADLRLRFVLPMVMRGLPVPGRKRLYIMLDTKREAERAGIPFGTVVDSVGAGAERALAVLHKAIPLGKGEEFAESGCRAVFADGIDIASDSGLMRAAKRAGLSPETVTEALADESWRDAVEENRQALFEAGLWGVPSFRVDGLPAHWGQDRFWALEQDIRASLEARP